MRLPGLPGRNARYGRFLAARTVSNLGNWVTLTALVLSLEESGASATAVGALLLARALPQALGPLAGTVADRVDGRRLMVLCDLGQAVVVAAIAVSLPPLWILVTLVALSSVFSMLFMPAGRSAIPSMVSREDLTSANALLASSSNVSFALGPALGGVLTALAGLRGSLFADVLTFLVSAALLRSVGALPPEEATTASGVRGFARELREGLSYVLGHRVARAVGLGLLLSVAFAAMDNVALVFFTQETLGAGKAGYGLASSAWAVGMILAPLLILRRAFRVDLVLLVGLGITGSGLVLTGLSPGLAFAVCALGLGGAGNGLENVGTDTIIQRTVAKPVMGRVFGTVYGLVVLGEGLAYAAGGPLLEATSPRAVFFVAGGGVLATLLLVRALLGPRAGEESRER